MPSPSANNVWTIAFGDYKFAIDRKALTYRLVETKTGTVWADGLPVGFQIAGPAFSEQRILDAAYALEQVIGFDHKQAFV